LLPSTALEITEQTQRRKIIRAMLSSCSENTYAATTISDIVRRARVSRSTFYKRFGDKRGCFDATVEFCIEQLRRTAAAAHSPGDSPADAVRMATVTVVERMAAEPELAQLLSGDAVTVEPAVVERYRRLVIPALAELWRQAGEATATHIDPRLAFSRAQLLVFNQIASGRADRLSELRPELVYLAVAPFAGHEEAVNQARLAETNDRFAAIDG
jgi:AcrR family transcriptional regulator